MDGRFYKETEGKGRRDRWSVGLAAAYSFCEASKSKAFTLFVSSWSFPFINDRHHDHRCDEWDPLDIIGTDDDGQRTMAEGRGWKGGERGGRKGKV